ncbi:hypothetical protein H3C61_00400 [Candidatus Gracilibacteria bacterium]|nr:hypothetical protein [Candidatus Gracilibacteria bacterium]
MNNRKTDVFNQETEVVDKNLNLEDFNKKLKSNYFLDNNRYKSFELNNIDGNINKWNKLKMKDILLLKFEKYIKDKPINFYIKFYINRSYSFKISGYFLIENNIDNTTSDLFSGEIKFVKIKGGRRAIFENQNIELNQNNNLKQYINESVLKEILVFKPIEGVENFKTWVVYKIKKILN